jgi:phosphoribosylformylglycinamidine cyclo-ligase
MADEQLTYRAAGVDIDEAHRALRSVLPNIQATYNDQVISGVGGFGGLFHAQFGDMERPVLVSSIDGIGTKTKVAAMTGQFQGLGHDIVNHCVNDILCQGARPLFFMDYFGTSRLSGLVFEEVVRGAAEACQKVGAVLIGGETAEMPGVYHDEEVDIVGSIVGVVDYDKRLPRQKMQPGDAVIGIASDGLHTNGYSLARRALFEVGGLSTRDVVPGLTTTIGEELLRPHRCYFPSLYPLLQQENSGIYGLAHITGGGLYDNVPRILPSDMQIVIERRSWSPLPIFRLIQETGNIPDSDMFRSFNMGIGMVVICDRMSAHGVVQQLNQAGEWAAIIGETQNGPHDVQII